MYLLEIHALIYQKKKKYTKESEYLITYFLFN